MLSLLWKKYLNRVSRPTRQSRRAAGLRAYRRNCYRPLELERLEDRVVLDATIVGGDTYTTIQAAIDAASAGAIINVDPGTYHENLTINKNITLLSTDGREATTIQGTQTGSVLGTILVTNNTTGVQIGDIGHGFTIVGIDGPTPGIESAAVYFQGDHSGAKIIGNEIKANGDEGLLTEYAATISNFLIDHNTFSGQTFVGANPGGDGFANQFTDPNVPRQLVVMGGGPGGGNTSNITFTNNTITGTAGGLNTDGHEQGNSLVTLDANGAIITGNVFAGTTTRYGNSLRARGPNTEIAGNTFQSDGLTPTTGQVYIQNSGQTLAQIAATNTFDKGVYLDGTTGAIGLSIQAFVNAAAAGDTVHILGGTYKEAVTITKDLTLAGSGSVLLQGQNSGTGITINNPAAHVTLQDLALQGWATGINASGLTTLTLQNLILTGNTSGGTLDDIQQVDYTPTAASVAANVTLTGDTFRNGTDDTVHYSNVTNLNVHGSDQADVFTVTPPPAGGTVLTVDGGKPTPPASPGDTLTLDLTGVDSPVLTANASADGYAGNWSALNRQQVNFEHIETVAPLPALQGAGTAVSGTQFAPLENVPVAQFTLLNNSYPANTFTAVINWGDGVSSLGTVVQTSDGYQVLGGHTYTSNGTFTVVVNVSGQGFSAVFSASATVAEAPLPEGVANTPANNFVNHLFNNLLHQPASAATIQMWGGLLGVYQGLCFQYFSNLGMDPFSSFSVGTTFAYFNVALGIVKGASPLWSLAVFNHFLSEGGDPFTSGIMATSLMGHGSAFTPASGSPSERVAAYYQQLGLPLDGLTGVDARALGLGLPDNVVVAIIAAQHHNQLS